MKLEALRAALAEPAQCSERLLFAFDSFGRALYDGCAVVFMDTRSGAERVGFVTAYDPKRDLYSIYDTLEAERRLVHAERVKLSTDPAAPVPNLAPPSSERLGLDRDGIILHVGDAVSWREVGQNGVARNRRSQVLGLSTSPQFDYIVVDSRRPSGTRELLRSEVKLAWPAKATFWKGGPKR